MLQTSKCLLDMKKDAETNNVLDNKPSKITNNSDCEPQCDNDILLILVKRTRPLALKRLIVIKKDTQIE